MFTTPFRLSRARVGVMTSALAALLLCFASSVRAELVQYEFTGVVSRIDGDLDVSKHITLGQPATLVFNVERSTAPYPDPPYGASYVNAIQSMSFAFGSYIQIAIPAEYGGTLAIHDNYYDPNEYIPPHSHINDLLNAQVPITQCPPIGAGRPTWVLASLGDYDATAFTSTAIPAALPSFGEFEYSEIGIQFWSDEGPAASLVWATVSQLSTPVPNSTWGRVKAGYRN